MLPTATSLHSIGKQLMAARVERGLSVEDIAFKTHIPAARVRELENDDFSNFANLTYAKGFLKIYSNYLDLDLSDYLEQFNTSDFANISGHDYIQSANTGLTSLSMAVAPRESSGRGGGIALIVVLAAALVAVPIWYWNHTKPEEPAPKPVSTAPALKARIVNDPPSEKPPTEDAEPILKPKAVPAPESPLAPSTSPEGTTASPLPPNVSPAAATLPPKQVEVRSATPTARVIPEEPEPAPEPTQAPPIVPQ